MVLVDDQSEDGTGPLIRRLSSDRLTVLTGGCAGLDRQALGDGSGH
jgi:hypothetical protein